MAARNTTASFGWVSRLLHWTMAAGIIAAIWLGLSAARTQIGLSTLWLFSWHKSLGFAMLVAALVRIGWHRLTPPPEPIAGSIPRWQLVLARVVHRLIYALMLLMPMVGWFASAATGPDVVVFGVALPRIAPTSQALADTGFALHRWLGYLLIAALVLHVAAAVYHAAWLRDGSFRRMLTGG